MRKYTTKDQTQQLINMGFPKPKYIDVDGYPPKDMLDEYASDKDEFGIVKVYENYTIGDMIIFLDTIKVRIDIGIGHAKPTCVNTNDGYICWNWELIDSLYDLCVKFKTKGII